MRKRLILLCTLLIVMLFLGGCGNKEITKIKAPEAAKTLSENLGIPCVSMEELKTNGAYYTDGCIVYGTVTKVGFDDFSEDSTHYKEYMDKFHQQLVEDSSPMIDELMLTMERDIKNKYSYMLYMDGDDYNIYGALRYETPTSKEILDIAVGDVIYAHVKPESRSVMSDNYNLNVITLTVYDETNRDESTKPVPSEKISKGNSESSTSSNTSSSDSTSSSTSNTDTASAETEVLEDASFSEPFFTVSGSGDDVVDGFYAEYLCRVHIERTGSKYFSVKAHYDDNLLGARYESLANTTQENYSGDFFIKPGYTYTFEVHSGGEWTIEAYYLGTSSSDTIEGKGDFVSDIVVSSADVYDIESTGKGFFSVKAYYQDSFLGLRYESIVNTTEEDYCGGVMLNKKGAQVFFVIAGERDWRIVPRSK